MAHSDSRGLGIRPFRGLRFVPEKVRNAAAVTSPPYDMIGPAEAQRLADTDEHNVVRLILPGAGEDPAHRYGRAAASLTAWIAEGALALDAEPALYVYEQTGPGGHQRGLVALVALDGAGDGGVVGGADGTHGVGEAGGADGAAEAGRVGEAGLTGEAGLAGEAGEAGEAAGAEGTGAGPSILPHEAVVPAVVDDRLAQMLATAANIEPILLTYAGDPAVSDLLDAAASGAPASETTTAEGTRHRLWAITDPARIAEVAGRLAGHRALIADGHHRHAAYHRLRGSLPGSESARYGLALLVDAARHPLSLHAIHRVLPRLPLDTAVDEARRVFAVREIGPGHRELAEAAPDRHVFVLSDGTRSYLLSDPDPAVLARAVPAGRPTVWRTLDATVLHHVLVEAVWKLPDTPEDVRFDHDPEHALAFAGEVGGTAVLLRPTTEAVVRELAAAGVLMPRKSTAFGPKPATGLVMRLLDEG